MGAASGVDGLPTVREFTSAPYSCVKLLTALIADPYRSRPYPGITQAAGPGPRLLSPTELRIR